MNDRSRPVISINNTTVEIGPCVVAASNAPAPSNANIPGGTPGQNADHTCPSNPPNNAPTVSDGVNNPPGAPHFTDITVATGRSTSNTSNSSGAT